MPLFSIRTTVSLLLASSLAACGGSDTATFVVGGTTVGLAYSGLKLKTGDQILAVEPVQLAGTPQTVSYAFPETINYGTTYTVSVEASPDKQRCAIDPAFGTNDKNRDSAGHTATINVPVRCNTYVYPLGGAVTGLTGAGLVLINGSIDTLPVDAGATTFGFKKKVFVDASYGISILTQPAGQSCTVLDGVGIMPNAEMHAATSNAITVQCNALIVGGGI